MPQISLLGWFHTIIGITALLSGAYTLAKFKEILLQNRSGQLYLLTTFVTAATSLMIFRFGTFGPAHLLGVMALLALLVGMVCATLKPIGKWSRYLQALSFSATLLFHSIPAVTDALMRLPVGDPILTSIEDPVLKICYLVLLVIFLIGAGLQLRWIHRQETV